MKKIKTMSIKVSKPKGNEKATDSKKDGSIDKRIKAAKATGKKKK